MSGEQHDGRPARPKELTAHQVFAERYQVEACIGQGGMGAVYRVRDRKLDEVVALKLLTLDSASAVERFHREVRLARRVTHPNVARTHDLGEHAGLHFLTMEYIRGTPLDRLIERRGALPPAQVMSIGAQIAAGLAAAHAAGVIHRDLKPANVIIAEDGRVLLTDFGIARAAHSDLRTHDTGALVGTPLYMAPEQVTGKTVDARVDIYALGLILYELCAGSLPFEAGNAVAVAVMRVHQAPDDPRTRAAVPDALAELILRCLAREPDARPQSAAEVQAELTIEGPQPPSLGAATASDSSERSCATTSGAPLAPTAAAEASLYAPLARSGDDTLAVLPFAYRGPAEHDYLGEGLAEELIDVLCRTKGLKVLSLNATRRFSGDRDPARMQSELGADAIVDGTVQLSGQRLRLSARLIHTNEGVQRWSDRFDGDIEDVFELQASMGQRVAEALRLQVQTGSHRLRVPQEAVELYLRARGMLRSDLMAFGEEAVALLDESLALAPGFEPALAAHAIGCVRAWWGRQDRDPARAERARESVARAAAHADGLPETQLALAMLATQTGDYRPAAEALGRALEIAPTLAEAHRYLGELQVEGGRLREGVKRMKLAYELDPSLNIVHFGLARLALYEGDLDTHHAHVRALGEAFPTPTVALLSQRLRWAAYRDDRAEVDTLVAALKATGRALGARLARVAEAALDSSNEDEALAIINELPSSLANPRFAALMMQFVAELFAYGGRLEGALRAVERATAGVLIDVDWMGRCPVLEPLRADPRFVEAQTTVTQRATSIWLR